MTETDQSPDQYLVIRVQLVQVKRGFLGLFRDEEISSRSYIPNQRADAYTLYEAIDKLAKKIIREHIEFILKD